jgi:hypothetical protein
MASASVLKRQSGATRQRSLSAVIFDLAEHPRRFRGLQTALDVLEHETLKLDETQALWLERSHGFDCQVHSLP